MELSLKNLSSEGQKLIEDNGFTQEMVYEFTEQDILEFTSMKDRFILRKLIRCTTKDPKSLDSHDHDQDSVELPVVQGSKSPSNVEHVGVDNFNASIRTSTTFLANELLQRKPKNGKCSAAQSYFSGLIKDSAKCSGIWRKAPMLSDISEKRREVFFEKVLKGAPQLKGHEHEVWNKLGGCLQNRRKYLRDLVSGKRCLKKKCVQNLSSVSATSPSANKGDKTNVPASPTCRPIVNMQNLPSVSATSPSENKGDKTNIQATPRPIDEDEQQDLLQPGNSVQLLCKSKKTVLAKGIYLRQMGDMFCEIVIQTVYDDISKFQNQSDLELPMSTTSADSINSSNVLGKHSINSVVVFKTQRLKKIVNRDQKKKTAVFTAKHTKKTASADHEVKTVKKRKTETQSVSTTAISAGCATSSGVKNKPDSGFNGKHNTHNLDKYSDYDQDLLCVFEWGRGQLFIGMHMDLNKDCTKVVSCARPVASIKNGQLQCPPKILPSMVTLNMNDTVENPDIRFKVMSSPFYKLDGFSASYIIPNDKIFFEHLASAFVDYKC